MKDKKWVQHMSGQGEKWEVEREWPHGWAVSVPHGVKLGDTTWLPKSEYRLTAPPEQYEDVTKKYAHADGDEFLCLLTGERFAYRDGMHNGPHFVIEAKKVS